ncbi:MAG: hypothetical protein K0B37_15225 [Bacteroidales bacterium]|nr:hypothetical protein [Bacteroidales bacterium]
MKTFPIFLLPKGETMMTAKITGNEIEFFKKTLFPSNKRYSISESGLAVCLDTEKKLIIYGNLSEDGDMGDVTVLPFPDIISPKSILTFKNCIVLGGENNNSYSGTIKSQELVAIYSLTDNKFTAVEMPFKHYDKCVDDLLLDTDNKVLAVDNIIFPKYLIEYDFSNPLFPNLIAWHSLPNNGTYETIKKGTLNDSYVALLSTSVGSGGSGTYINIFRKGDYVNHVGLSQYRNFNQNIDKNCLWRDILLLPNRQFLFISSHEKGIGVYFIKNSKIKNDFTEDSDSIKYINKWNKPVKKILLHPQSDDTVLIIFEEGGLQNLLYSFSLESIDLLLSNFEQ